MFKTVLQQLYLEMFRTVFLYLEIFLAVSDGQGEFATPGGQGGGEDFFT